MRSIYMCQYSMLHQPGTWLTGSEPPSRSHLFCRCSLPCQSQPYSVFLFLCSSISITLVRSLCLYVCISASSTICTYVSLWATPLSVLWGPPVATSSGVPPEDISNVRCWQSNLHGHQRDEIRSYPQGLVPIFLTRDHI